MSIGSRSGLSKDKVKLARQTLLAKQQYPSVDAVRIALGNTGSKTTIHKYLKELEQEEGNNTITRPNLTETLQNFVAQLAQQLHVEAEEKINQIQQQAWEKEQQHRAEFNALEASYTTLDQQLALKNVEYVELEKNHQQLTQTWHAEQIEKSRNQQQLQDLERQLHQSEQYKNEILEKFQHAQKSLEHYRESVKEQRQQELRRHDSAIQHLQNEIRQLQQSLSVDRSHITELRQENHELKNQYHHLLQQQQQDVQQYQQVHTAHQSLQVDYQQLQQQHEQSQQQLHQLSLDLNQTVQKLQHHQDTDSKNSVLEQQTLMLQTELHVQKALYHELLQIIQASQNTTHTTVASQNNQLE